MSLLSKTMLQYNNNSFDRQISDKKAQVKITPHIPKLVQIQFAQFLNNLLEYASELTYFSINAFQTSSLRRVQINTLLRYNDYCVPRTCAFYYNLDSEFDHFVQKMRLLCATAKRTFLDMRMARIHYTNGTMMNLPIIRRSLEIFKCNINRLRDLKQIHQEIGYDLLLPHDQLYIALDLLVTDFELLNCELDAEVKFADAMVLQTIIKDIFLQYRIALTWIYPAVKQAAYRPGDFNPQRTIHKSKSLHVQPAINTNQNYVSVDDRPRKRKCSTKCIETTAARDDLTRYLSEKKLHNRGLVNVRKYNSSKNLIH